MSLQSDDPRSDDPSESDVSDSGEEPSVSDVLDGLKEGSSFSGRTSGEDDVAMSYSLQGGWSRG